MLFQLHLTQLIINLKFLPLAFMRVISKERYNLNFTVFYRNYNFLQSSSEIRGEKLVSGEKW